MDKPLIIHEITRPIETFSPVVHHTIQWRSEDLVYVSIGAFWFALHHFMQNTSSAIHRSGNRWTQESG
jgi:hypothetical protein